MNLKTNNTSATGRFSPAASIWKNGTELSETTSYTYSRGDNYNGGANVQINTSFDMTANEYIEVKAWAEHADDSSAVNTGLTETEFLINRITAVVC